MAINKKAHTIGQGCFIAAGMGDILRHSGHTRCPLAGFSGSDELSPEEPTLRPGGRLQGGF